MIPGTSSKSSSDNPGLNAFALYQTLHETSNNYKAMWVFQNHTQIVNLILGSKLPFIVNISNIVMIISLIYEMLSYYELNSIVK